MVYKGRMLLDLGYWNQVLLLILYIDKPTLVLSWYCLQHFVNRFLLQKSHCAASKSSSGHPTAVHTFNLNIIIMTAIIIFILFQSPSKQPPLKHPALHRKLQNHLWNRMFLELFSDKFFFLSHWFPTSETCDSPPSTCPSQHSPHSPAPLLLPRF